MQSLWGTLSKLEAAEAQKPQIVSRPDVSRQLFEKKGMWMRNLPHATQLEQLLQVVTEGGAKKAATQSAERGGQRHRDNKTERQQDREAERQTYNETAR